MVLGLKVKSKVAGALAKIIAEPSAWTKKYFKAASDE